MSLPLANAAGKYPLEPLPKGWGYFERVKSDGKIQYEVIDLRFKDVGRIRYKHEPMKMIAVKCFLLYIAGLSLYFLAYTAIHLVRMPIVTIVHCSPQIFVEQLWALVKIPLYFLALEFAALYGIVRPLEGRALFSGIEACLHGSKKDRWTDVRMADLPSNSEILRDTLCEKENHYSLFAGVCFQSLGRTDDQRISKPSSRLTSRWDSATRIFFLSTSTK